jgi:predicted dehydrogenase
VDKRVGLGFAGLGVLGGAMLEHIHKIPELRVAAVQDVKVELAASMAERYATPHFQRFEDLLAFPEVEAIVISTPNVFHVPQARAALTAGKAVLVQKPLATSAADARAILDLAASNGQIMFVDYSYRLLETMMVLRQALPEVGPVRSVSAAFGNPHAPSPDRGWFLNPDLSGGGALIDMGVHLLDALLWVFQPRRAALQRATLESTPGFAVELDGRLDLALDDVPVSLHVGWNWPTPTEINLVIDGERAQLRWDNVDGSFNHFKTRLDDRLLLDKEIALRENTLRRFAATLASRSSPPVDTRVYDILDQAYRWDASGGENGPLDDLSPRSVAYGDIGPTPAH